MNLAAVLENLRDRVSCFGKLPLCNLQVDRAPHIFNFCFPLCWRCTSILAGALLTKLVVNTTKLNLNFNFAICISLQIPIITDGLRQYLTDYESNNFKRIITGALSGLGAAALNL